MALAAVVGCVKENQPDKTPEEQSVTLSVEPTSVTINAKGEALTVKVTTNAEKWTAAVEEKDSWCILEQKAGTLVISAQENTSVESRAVDVIVSAEDKEVKIEVKQEGAAKVFAISQNTAELNPDGSGKVSIEVTSNLEWTAVLDDETYFKLETTESGFDISALSANNTTNERAAKVTVSAEGMDALEVDVTQGAGLRLYHIEISSIDFTDGRVKSINDADGNLIAKICREYIRESSSIFGQKTVLYLVKEGSLDMKHGIELESGRTITWDPASSGEIISFSTEGTGALSDFWIDNSGNIVTELDSETDLTPRYITDRLMDNRDGEVYGIVKIGVHWWLTENLRTKKYTNGDPIAAAYIDSPWGESGAYAYDTEAPEKCGYYYNGLAVNDERGLAPEGWMVPDNETWTLLITRYTRKGSARYKSTESESGWTKDPAKPANDPTNDTGFNAYMTFYVNAEAGGIMDSTAETWFWSSSSVYDTLTKKNINIYVRITNSGANLVFDPSLGLGHTPEQFAHNVRCAKKCFEF